jgi:hypothetical protein
VTVISSALGTRIDCDRCGEHVVTPRHSTPALRLATGYALLDGRDYCPRCAGTLSGARFDEPRPEPPDSGPAAA